LAPYDTPDVLPSMTSVEIPPGPSLPVRTIATSRSVPPAPEMNCFWPLST
jgi:hypothetical protein